MKVKRKKVITLTLLICIVTGVGVACARKSEENPSADQRAESQVADTTDKGDGQDHTKETQEAQPIDTYAPYVSRFAAEEAQVISGECGTDAVWTYDTGSKLLQITGTGVVDQRIKKSEEYVSDYGHKKRYHVKEIRVGEGITALDAGPLFLNVSKAKGAKEIKLSLPDSLEKIGADTFDPGQYSAKWIRHIHLPRNVRCIEGGAFWGLGENITNDSYEDAVKYLSKKYKHNFKITVDSENPNYIVKDGVLYTKDEKTLVYYPSEKTDKIYRIPKSVTHIGALAFARNSFLEEVVLPDGIKVIGGGAFFNDHRLAEINLGQANKLKRLRDFDGIKHKISLGCWTGVPEGMEIPDEEDDSYCDSAEIRKGFYDSSTSTRKDYYSLGTFAGTNLKSIQFPDSLKYAAYNTFKNCVHLEKISIGSSFAGEINPDHLCDKKGFSLAGLSGIDIRVSAKNTHYKVEDHILYSKDGTTLYQPLKSFHSSVLVLDKKVQKIAREAFAEGSAPEKVIVQGDLKQISCSAFMNSAIRVLEVYGNIDTIGNAAFRRCNDLQKFICHGTVKNIGEEAFYEDYYLEEISLGDGLQSIGKNAFEGCDRVKKPHVKNTSH